MLSYVVFLRNFLREPCGGCHFNSVSGHIIGVNSVSGLIIGDVRYLHYLCQSSYEGSISSPKVFQLVRGHRNLPISFYSYQWTWGSGEGYKTYFRNLLEKKSLSNTNVFMVFNEITYILDSELTFIKDETDLFSESVMTRSTDTAWINCIIAPRVLRSSCLSLPLGNLMRHRYRRKVESHRKGGRGCRRQEASRTPLVYSHTYQNLVRLVRVWVHCLQCAKLEIKNCI